MKIKIALALLLLLIAETSLFAVRRRGDYFTRTQLGIWFGPVAPLFDLSEELESDLGVGFFARVNTPLKPIKIAGDISYQQHGSEGLSQLTMMPLYSSVQWRLPIPSPLNFLLKAGGGSTQIWVEPDGKSRWDPTIYSGFELSFPAGKLVNIGLRLDYLMLYEKHLEGAQYNGHFFNAGICVFFNL